MATLTVNIIGPPAPMTSLRKSTSVSATGTQRFKELRAILLIQYRINNGRILESSEHAMRHETFWKSRATVDPTTGGAMTLAATAEIVKGKYKLQVGFCAGVYESEMYWGECA